MNYCMPILKKNGGIIPFCKKWLYYGMALPVHEQSSRYFIEMYMLGQDNVSHTKMIVPHFLVSKLCSFEFCKKKKLVRIITQ